MCPWTLKPVINVNLSKYLAEIQLFENLKSEKIKCIKEKPLKLRLKTTFVLQGPIYGTFNGKFDK